MSKQETLITEAIEAAKVLGCRIVPRACFHREQDRVVACSAYGALLLQLGRGCNQPGNLKAVCELLGVSPRWLYRFEIGFSNQLQLQINTERDSTKPPKWEPDEVCRLGVSLSKRYVEWKT